MIQKNIPLSFDPSCHFPDRIKGQLWSNLNLDEYACPPSFFPGDTFNFIRSQHQQTQSSQKYLSSSYSSSSSSSSSFSASSFPDSTDQFHFTEGMLLFNLIILSQHLSFSPQELFSSLINNQRNIVAEDAFCITRHPILPLILLSCDSTQRISFHLHL